MTDKQIIYNCPHISFTDWGTYACKLYDPRDKNCLVKGGNCDSNISCPYKQLKLAEQRIVELNKTIKAKEQECEELKAERDSWHYQWEKRYEIGECLSDKIDQYKQAIEKIKEIAENNLNIHTCAFKGCGYDLITKQTLQICDEVTK